MESLSELKQELTEWFDQRIKTAVDDGNADLMKDLDTRFGTLEQGINDLGATMSDVSKDVGGVSDSVAKMATTLLAIPTQIGQEVLAAIGNLNPFK